MPISLEELKKKGQIKTINLSDLQKMGKIKVVAPSLKKQSGLDKLANNPITKGFEKTAEFLFGSTAKTVGGMITGGIGDAMWLKGYADRDKKTMEQGQKLQAIRDKNLTKTNIAFTALELYPGGGQVTKALKKLPGGEAVANFIAKSMPESLRAGAVKGMSEALGATTKELKAKTAKVAPELLKRKTVIASLPKFADEAAALKNQAGQAVKKAENMLPVFKKQAVKPLVEKVSKMRSRFIVNGKIIDENAVRAIDNVIDSVIQFGDEIPETQLVKIKRILDKSVSIANKNFTKDEGLSLATEAKEGIANAIRNVLNSSNPKLAAANKEFSLWADVVKITEETLKRRSTQTGGLTRFIGPLIGGGAGLASGNAINAAAGYFATSGAIKLLQSPLWKTVSAKTKNDLAEYLAKGRLKEALMLTAKLLAGIKNEVTEE